MKGKRVQVNELVLGKQYWVDYTVGWDSVDREEYNGIYNCKIDGNSFRLDLKDKHGCFLGLDGLSDDLQVEIYEWVEEVGTLLPFVGMKDKIELLKRLQDTIMIMNGEDCTGSRKPTNGEITDKLNEVIDKVNQIIERLNG